MARLMNSEAPEAFRAVITVRDVGDTYEGGVWEHTHYAGPYGTVGAARAAITREQRSAEWYRGRRHSRTVTGYVERSSMTWERVE